MNWPLIINSLSVAFAAAALAVAVGFVVALWIGGLSGIWRTFGLVGSACALTLPPFLVTNTWLEFFGDAGKWRSWLDFDLYSLGGTVLLLTLMIWPVALFLVVANWRRLQPSLFESEAKLRGRLLVGYLLLPVAKIALVQAFLISFVIALNQFSIPAILQVKVFPAEIWIILATVLDYSRALLLSLPMIAVPIIMLLWFSRNPVRWPRVENPVSPRLFQVQLGKNVHSICGVFAIAVLLLSVGLPFYQLLSNVRTWSEFVPAFLASQDAVLNSFQYAFVVTLLALVAGWVFWKMRLASATWLFFFMPGIVLAIGLGWVVNRPFLGFLYGTSVGLVIGLAIRFVAICREGIRSAILSSDRDLIDSAALSGANAWQTFRFVHWPQICGTVLATAYLVYLFCLWDVETSILLIPPGGDTLASKIFNLLHYGHTGQVNALCLILLIVAVLPLVPWGIWNFSVGRMRTASLMVLPFLIFSGCDLKSAGEDSLNSQFFSSVEIIGHKGTGPGEFNKPRSVAVDWEDCLYVVDMTGRVQKFSPEGEFLLSWQMPETVLGRPKGMCTDLEGNIVVLEPHYQRVNHFTPNGELVRQWGRSGTNAGQLHLPRAIAENSHGEFILSEYSQIDRVQRFANDGETVLNVVGQSGLEPGEFNRPEGLGIDAQDRIYVADSVNHRIQVFSREGEFLRTYGHAGKETGELSYPYDIRIDRNGFQYVCEFGNSRIQIFDKHDHPVEILGGVGSAPGQFFNPWSIAFDSQENLYVTDSQNHRVQKFIRKVQSVEVVQK